MWACLSVERDKLRECFSRVNYIFLAVSTSIHAVWSTQKNLWVSLDESSWPALRNWQNAASGLYDEKSPGMDTGKT
jgi:hypothetical protein